MIRRFTAVEPLSAAHAVAGFDCGSRAQSDWLVDHALQAHRSGLSRVYVVRDLDHVDGRVVGYYSLAAGSVAPVDASHRLMLGTGRHYQPAMIMTRLGVGHSA